MVFILLALYPIFCFAGAAAGMVGAYLIRIGEERADTSSKSMKALPGASLCLAFGFLSMSVFVEDISSYIYALCGAFIFGLAFVGMLTAQATDWWLRTHYTTEKE